MAHQPNHKETLDELLKFSGTPSDATRTQPNFVPTEPQLNLPLANVNNTRPQGQMSNAPMTREEVSELATGFVTPMAGTVRGLQQGGRLVENFAVV